MNELDRRRLDRALARLGEDDPEGAEHAASAMEWLVGDDLGELTQAGVQDFLWYRLPRRWLVDAATHRRAADALGALFDLLGLARYAALCRAPVTRELLALWEQDEAAAWPALTRAQDRSGVEPPDTDTLAWSELMGLTEAAAQRTASVALEDAIESGTLVPGQGAWRRVQRRIVDEVLAASHPHEPGTWLEAVQAERLERWVDTARSPVRARLAAEVAPTLATPVTVPDGAEVVTGPVAHLLDLAADGVALTATHRLTPATVTAMAERFGWWAPGTRRLEDDVTEVWRTRELAERLRAVRRRKQQLVLTPQGRALRAEAAACWRAVAAHLARDEGLAGAGDELALLLLAHHTTMAEADLHAEVHRALVDEGWHDVATGAPVPAGSARSVVWSLLAHLTYLGVVVEQGPWDARTVTLTAVGRPTVPEGLRAAALRAVGR
jgi:hypothetical protein